MLSHRYHRVGKVGRQLWRLSGLVPSSRRVICSRLIRAMFSQNFNLSKGGDSTISLGSLFHCSTTHTVRKHGLVFRLNFLSLIWTHCVLSFLWGLLSIFCLPHLHSLPSNILCTLIRPLCGCTAVPPSQTFLTGGELQSLNYLCGLLLGSFHYFQVSLVLLWWIDPGRCPTKLLYHFPHQLDRREKT